MTNLLNEGLVLNEIRLASCFHRMLKNILHLSCEIPGNRASVMTGYELRLPKNCVLVQLARGRRQNTRR